MAFFLGENILHNSTVSNFENKEIKEKNKNKRNKIKLETVAL